MDSTKFPGHRFGEKHPQAKLTVEQVRLIRARLAAGERSVTLAKEMGVCESTIHIIKYNKSWKHLE